MRIDHIHIYTCKLHLQLCLVVSDFQGSRARPFVTVWAMVCWYCEALHFSLAMWWHRLTIHQGKYHRIAMVGSRFPFTARFIAAVSILLQEKYIVTKALECPSRITATCSLQANTPFVQKILDLLMVGQSTQRCGCFHACLAADLMIKNSKLQSY